MTIVRRDAGLTEAAEVSIENRADAVAMRLLDAVTRLSALWEVGRAREVFVFGKVEGLILSGVIDEIRLDKKLGYVSIVDTKTRKT